MNFSRCKPPDSHDYHSHLHIFHTHNWVPHSLICSIAPEIRLYQDIVHVHGHEKSDKTSKAKNLKFLSRRIVIEVVIMKKKLCKQG